MARGIMTGMTIAKPFRFDGLVVGMLHDGSSVLAAQGNGPVRFEGFTVGCYLMKESAPHDGEIHPDGDELVLVISGESVQQCWTPTTARKWSVFDRVMASSSRRTPGIESSSRNRLCSCS